MTERFDPASVAVFRVHGPDVRRDTVELRYSFDDEWHFVERITVDGPPDERLLPLLAALAGVSYYKAAGPLPIDVEPPLTAAEREAVTLAYDHGLRELAVHNGLPVPMPVTLTAPTATRAHGSAPAGRLLVPIGGGKDSAVVARILAPLDPLLVSVRANPPAAAIAERLGLEHAVVERVIDPVILSLNRCGARNGHIPVTAITSLVAAVTASTRGRDTIVMANERSASAPTLHHDGHAVNHQYAKSFTFERALAAALPSDYAYFSLLRPWSELAIARAFATMTELHDVFMSCNRAYLLDPARRSAGWCGACAKCHFVFLVLAPFMPPPALVRIFGRDLLDDGELTGSFRSLFVDAARPFECVGEARECAAAVLLLADAPAWRDHAVVRSLMHDAARVLGGEVPADVFDPSDEHAVPAAFAALADPFFAA